MAAIVFEAVTKVFGSAKAVDSLDLEIEDGEFLVLVGPSGCGKSTALRMLAGLEEVTSGNIYIGDRLVNNVRSRDRDIAMVFQSYALYPHMSVYDNIAFALRLRGLDRREIEVKVAGAARMLAIEPLLKRKPGQLSGGQRQRVALGRAIVREPRAFLLDEPLSNLDAQLRVQTRAEISKLHERLGATFVYVTHDQVEALTMADRIAVLQAGVLQQVGTPEDLYERPSNLFVATFIGSPSMNVLEAEVVREGEQLYVGGQGWRLALGAGQTRSLGDLAGTSLLAGIRPEHLHDPAFTPVGVQGATIEATVDFVEAMGSESYLHLALPGGGRLIARVDPRTAARAGHTFQALVDQERMHLFHPESKEALV